jgi:hypothetical protein
MRKWIYLSAGVVASVLVSAVFFWESAELKQWLASDSQVSPEVAREYAGIARDAYLYSVPLLNTYRDLDSAMSDKSAQHYVGSFNNLKHRKDEFVDGNRLFRVDAWLDLRAEPMLLHIPPEGSKNSSIKILDLFGGAVGYIGAGSDLAAGGNYLVAGANWDGDKPLGVKSIIRSRTDLVRLQGQTLASEQAEDERLQTWYGSLALVPLSAYHVEPPPPRAPRFKLPAWDEDAMASIDFISYVNFMLQFIHPDAGDAAQLIRFERIGMLEGMPLAPDSYTGAIAAGIAQARGTLAAAQELAIIRPN